MTNQETFDIVVTHLRTQGKKAIGPNGYCCYRTPDGLKCAAGCLIPDSKYHPSFENKLVYHSPIAEILAKEGHYWKLVADLQTVHDEMDVDEWEYEFRFVANEYGLEYKGVQS